VRFILSPRPNAKPKALSEATVYRYDLVNHDEASVTKRSSVNRIIRSFGCTLPPPSPAGRRATCAGRGDIGGIDSID